MSLRWSLARLIQRFPRTLKAANIWRTGLVACLLLCAACAQAPTVPVTPAVAARTLHMEQGVASVIAELDQKQDWASMLRLAQSRLQLAPENTDWWFFHGYALARQGQHAAAIVSYEKAVRFSPEDEGAWLALAQSQIEVGMLDGAARTYQQVLRYRPESAQAYLALAELYQRQGRTALAVANYRESVRYDPSWVQAWYGLAAAYQKSGQAERRDEALAQLRKLDPAAAAQFEREYPAKR